MIIQLPNLSIPSTEEVGARLRATALAVAPAIAFAYTAGFVTGQFLHSLNNRLVELTR